MEEKIKKEPNENFSEMQSSKKIKLEKDFEETKEEQEQDFLFVYEQKPKMPLKKEIPRKEVKGAHHKTTFSDHQCGICQKYFSSKRVLDNHIEVHFKPSNFECKKCKKIYVRKYDLLQHKCRTDLICHVCKKSFSRFGTLQKHLRNVHNVGSSSGQTFTCDYCGKVFKDKFNIKQHVLTHVAHKVECKICHLMIKPKSLSYHMFSIHPDEQKNFECSICFKVLRNGRLLYYHLKAHDKKFQCSVCKQKFPDQSQLRAHMSFHENPEQFKCKICGHQMKSKGNLGRHMKVHDETRKKNFECDRCDYKTDTKGNLKEHFEHHLKLDRKLRENPKAVKCEKCPSVLKNETCYNRHQRYKHLNQF